MDQDLLGDPSEATLKVCQADEANRRVTVLIVDDTNLMRTNLSLFISQVQSLTVVGTACDGLEAVEQVRLLRPDLVLLDVRMPVMDGIEAASIITAEHPGTIVIGLSAIDTPNMRQRMLQAGATAFLEKSEILAKLVPAITAALAARLRPGRPG